MEFRVTKDQHGNERKVCALCADRRDTERRYHLFGKGQQCA